MNKMYIYSCSIQCPRPCRNAMCDIRACALCNLCASLSADFFAIICACLMALLCEKVQSSSARFIGLAALMSRKPIIEVVAAQVADCIRDIGVNGTRHTIKMRMPDWKRRSKCVLSLCRWNTRNNKRERRARTRLLRT